MGLSILEKMRRDAFWIIDRALKGNRITHNINEIKSINENKSSKKTKKLSQQSLANLLNHASSKSEFYKNFNYRDLNDFPIINKSIINNNHSKFLTKSVEDLFETTTSGSTGTPLIIYQDDIKRARHIADNIYFNELAGFKIGTKLYYFRVWNEKNKKTFLNKWIQNVEMVDISVMSPKHLDELLEKMIDDKSNKSILSFASSLDVFKNYCSDKIETVNKLKLNCIISMSETLSPDTREFLENHVRCNVVSRYSNMENGFIAQQMANSTDYLINEASFLVEILQMDKDLPEEDGKMGRIVVTDLFNYGMPIIRYDTGDIGIKGVDGQNNPVLKSIEGRRIDFITNTKGELLSPHIITNSMWFFAGEINQFQFIQKSSKNYILKLNMKDENAKISINRIHDKLLPYLGRDGVINVEYVNEIPLLASGKRKKIVNLMKNNLV